MSESLTRIFLSRHMHTASEPLKPTSLPDPNLSNSLTVTPLHCLKSLVLWKSRLSQVQLPLQPLSRPVPKPQFLSANANSGRIPSVGPQLFQRGLKSAQGRFLSARTRGPGDSLEHWKSARGGGFAYRLSVEGMRKRTATAQKDTFRGQVTGKRLTASMHRVKSILLVSGASNFY